MPPGSFVTAAWLRASSPALPLGRGVCTRVRTPAGSALLPAAEAVFRPLPAAVSAACSSSSVLAAPSLIVVVAARAFFFLGLRWLPPANEKAGLSGVPVACFLACLVRVSGVGVLYPACFDAPDESGLFRSAGLAGRELTGEILL
jgi:hypothetical protein